MGYRTSCGCMMNFVFYFYIICFSVDGYLNLAIFKFFNLSHIVLTVDLKL